MKKVRKRVIEISTRIVTISPGQGWWKRKWSVFYQHGHPRLTLTLLEHALQYLLLTFPVIELHKP